MSQAPNTPASRLAWVRNQTVLITLIGTVLGVALLLGAVVFLFFNTAVILGGLEVWRKNPWVLVLLLLLTVGGMGVLFATLFLLRGKEREQPTLRRLIYGYNAVLTGVLLLGVLAVVNFLVYVPVKPLTAITKSYDWTEQNLYTLDSQTQQALEGLDQPLRIYVLLPRAGASDDPDLNFVAAEMPNLLSQIKAANPTRVIIDQLSPDTAKQQIADLQKEYKFDARVGLFLVYGTEPNVQQAMIPYDRLVDRTDPEAGERFGRRVFMGEAELLAQLRSFKKSTGGKEKKTIYFTTGHDELDLSVIGHTGRPGDADGIGMLKSKLEKAGYEVKSVSLTGPGDRIPADADLVVVARPLRPFEAGPLAALREYMGMPGTDAPGDDGKPREPRKGRMIVLFDVVLTPQNTMVPTLEDFVKDFAVDVQNSRLLSLNEDSPTVIPVSPAGVPAVFPFEDARPLQLNVSPQVREQGFRAQSFLEARRTAVLITDNLAAQASRLVKEFRKPGGETNPEVRRPPANPVVGAFVAETLKKEGSEKAETLVPRMFVAGDSSWVANPAMAGPSGEGLEELFLVATSVVLQEPDLGKPLDPKARRLYRLGGPVKINPEDFRPGADPDELQNKLDKAQEPRRTLYWKVTLMPAVVIVLSIIGLGLGVWVLRRR